MRPLHSTALLCIQELWSITVEWSYVAVSCLRKMQSGVQFRLENWMSVFQGRRMSYRRSVSWMLTIIIQYSFQNPLAQSKWKCWYSAKWWRFWFGGYFIRYNATVWHCSFWNCWLAIFFSKRNECEIFPSHTMSFGCTLSWTIIWSITWIFSNSRVQCY